MINLDLNGTASRVELRRSSGCVEIMKSLHFELQSAKEIWGSSQSFVVPSIVFKKRGNNPTGCFKRWFKFEIRQCHAGMNVVLEQALTKRPGIKRVNSLYR